MTEVLIVAKTNMSRGTYCIGGVQLGSLRSLRLVPSNQNSHPKDTPLDVGQVWDFTLQEMPPAQVTAPHVEDIRVLRGKMLRAMLFNEVRDFVLDNIDVPTVHPKDLFFGRLQFKQSEKKRITPEGGIPLKSTGFWRLDGDLILQEIEGKARYVCFDHSRRKAVLDLPFLGQQSLADVIPAGTLLRLSLSRWFNDGYWLQLSGWFM